MIEAIIVEDDPMVAQINKKYMESFQQIKIRAVFRNGAEALEYIREKNPRLIILDMYMPKMTGMELLRIIRAENIKSDVIMVTAANEVEKVDESLRLGIVDYLVKPFEYDRFRKAVTKFLKKANILDQGSTLSQETVDKLINTVESDGDEPNVLKKGIQQLTLNHISSCITVNPHESFTCEDLAVKVKLSKVTVRRYLNYLIEQDKLESAVDYGTGGRPSLVYRLRNSKYTERGKH